MRLLASVVILAVTLGASRAGELSPGQINAAKKLYNNKCAKCHKFYDPGHYAQNEWETWMQKMGKKSKLKPEQYELLSRYLETFRTPPKE
jgi:nitrate/TMAO reductase-like tetraheme cytochrome c subunit